MGAKLTSGNELQEWLARQEYLRRNPEQQGSNVFTYKGRHHQRDAAEDQDADQAAANESLMNEVQLLRLKSQKSMSGMPTRATSQEQDVNKWSYFEKLERLKLKIV